MEKSPFRSASELEARRALHEAIGRFVVAFELVIGELRAACRIMLERSGLKNHQPLADVVLARKGARELTELTGAMYKEFRPNDLDGAKALEDKLLKGVEELCAERNRHLHAAWTLGIADHPGESDPVAHALNYGRQRKKGRTILQLDLRPEDFDKLTDEAEKLKVYAVRLCQSVISPSLPLARHLNRPI